VRTSTRTAAAHRTACEVDHPAFNTLPWDSQVGCKIRLRWVEAPRSDTRFLDLHRCAKARYADEITGVLKGMALPSPS